MSGPDPAALGAACAIMVGLLLVLARAFLGPTTWDRILAVNTVGTKTVILLAVLGFLARRPEFLDIAVVYALLNFIATVAVLKFVQHRRLG